MDTLTRKEQRLLIMGWLESELGWTDESTGRYRMYRMMLKFIRETTTVERSKSDETKQADTGKDG